MFESTVCSEELTNTKDFTQSWKTSWLGEGIQNINEQFQHANGSQLDTRVHVKFCNCWKKSSLLRKICLPCSVRALMLWEEPCLNSTTSSYEKLVPLEDFFLETIRILMKAMFCVLCPQSKQFWTFAHGWTPATGIKMTFRQRRCQLSRGPL